MFESRPGARSRTLRGAPRRVGRLRRRRLERSLADIVVVQPDDQTIILCAELRLRCQQSGHALANKLHDGDRWIAITAIRLDMPLVSHDGVFTNTPGLSLQSANGTP